MCLVTVCIHTVAFRRMLQLRDRATAKLNWHSAKPLIYCGFVIRLSAKLK